MLTAGWDGQAACLWQRHPPPPAVRGVVGGRDALPHTGLLILAAGQTRSKQTTMALGHSKEAENTVDETKERAALCGTTAPSQAVSTAGAHQHAESRSRLSPPRNAGHVWRNEGGALHAEAPRLHASTRRRREAFRRFNGGQRVACEVAVVSQQPL